jgi:hypothetical protein
MVAGSELTYDAVFGALLADGYQGAASIEHWGSPQRMLQGVRELAVVLKLHLTPLPTVGRLRGTKASARSAPVSLRVHTLSQPRAADLALGAWWG